MYPTQILAAILSNRRNAAVIAAVAVVLAVIAAVAVCLQARTGAAPHLATHYFGGQVRTGQP